ncbi:MAG: FUSC family protein [Nocardioides sp.]|uniref:FUSC family protein n=1 Tax=Nocardioides sp. TaxID=35761 RepID=UPI0039E70363
MAWSDQARADLAQALRVAFGLLVPGAILLVVDRPDLIVYAAFGSFAGMYGRNRHLLARLRQQAIGAVVLLCGVGIGVALVQHGASDLTLVAAAAPFAVAVSLLADRLGLRPEGPFYGLFALGATAAVPAGSAEPWQALGLCAATALFAMGLGVAESLVLRHGWIRVPWEPIRPRSAGIVHALRYAVAITGAGLVGSALHLEHVNWVLAGAAVTLAAEDSRMRVRRGVHRVIGTVAGLAVTVLLLLGHPDPTVLAALVIAFLFPTELFMHRNYALALGFFTPMIMLMTDLAAPTDTRTLVVDRGAGTLLGVAVGIVVALAIRDEPREA